MIPTSLPIITNEKDLSSDQKYLLHIMKAISTGKCSPDLANRRPGQLSHSRWLTTANRILRLYVATTNPSENLKILSKYVMTVYGPMWFEIKLNPSCTKGANHLWLTIKRSRYLDNDLKKVIDPVIQRNGFFGHPENLLLCMLADDRKIIRELAYRRILKARSQLQGQVIRAFTIPAFNFEASDYIDLIDWQTSQITEPPLTANLSAETLRDIVESAFEPGDKVLLLPCHTQAVERCIKLVTEASESVCGQEARDGFIRERLRKDMPLFETKSDYSA